MSTQWSTGLVRGTNRNEALYRQLTPRQRIARVRTYNRDAKRLTRRELAKRAKRLAAKAAAA